MSFACNKLTFSRQLLTIPSATIQMVQTWSSHQLNRLWLFTIGIAMAQTSAGIAQTAPRPAHPPQQKAQTAPAKSSATATKTTAKPAAKPAEQTGADVTTASFDDWQMSCRATAASTGQPSRRMCEVLQSVIQKGQTAPFVQLGFGKVEPAAQLFFTAVVPNNVSFPSTVKVAVDEKDKHPLEVAWTRCLPGGCFASVAVNDEVVTRWRTQNEGGRLTFKNGAGQDLIVPISFKGLGRALDALAKEG